MALWESRPGDIRIPFLPFNRYSNDRGVLPLFQI